MAEPTKDEVEATIKLPDGAYVIFTEAGAGHASRIVIQFQDLSAMQKAHHGLIASIKSPASRDEYVDGGASYQLALDTVAKDRRALSKARTKEEGK